MRENRLAGACLVRAEQPLSSGGRDPGNLVGGMKWFLGTCTSRFNRRHRLSGHLWGLGIPKDSRAGRREFEKAMEARRTEDDPKAWAGNFRYPSPWSRAVAQGLELSALGLYPTGP